jgi:hypothetical protein
VPPEATGREVGVGREVGGLGRCHVIEAGSFSTEQSGLDRV